ncbi:Serine/arginine repetitive matrix protein [Ceratobasidium sp. AG-Ba]|nr:Serine/arginine repetitive matrix protein [Ceratobasidium sp. AG-Ba]QRW02759.1 Serine/arginine repetitive matrix protein [Ceratobasidium sp. AG-Ba]
MAHRSELNLPTGPSPTAPPAMANSSAATAPTWTASYSKSLRRPLTSGDIPASPASSSASQKFEVKRLLSRPADPMPSPRPLTTFDASTSYAGPSESSATVKRSNSASRFLKRRPSKGRLESTEPTAVSRPRTTAAEAPRPLAPYTPPAPSPAISTASTPTLTPASAYALAYARRTNMTTLPTGASARHPFEAASTGRLVALGDPADETLSLSTLSLAGFGAEKEREKEREKEKEKDGGLARKVSARFRSRRKTENRGVLSDAETEDWTREKERVGIRAMGMARPGRSATVSRRMSRHLSIEDFRALVIEGGSKFEIEGRAARKDDRARAREAERRLETSRPRQDSTSHQSSTHSHTICRKDETPRSKDNERAKEARPSRSVSTPAPPLAESRMAGATSPESKTSSGGGMIWRLVKKMSTGTLKEKRSSQVHVLPLAFHVTRLTVMIQPEKIPPVPRLPATLPSSRRSSVADYGEEIRPELSQFRANSHSSQHSSRPNTVHQSSGDMSNSHHSHHRTVPATRPSMTHTTESSVLSASPPTSFGRTGSPRTSMSSYVDVAEEIPPPPPLPTLAVGKHIVAPGELNQMFVAGAATSSPQTPSKRPRKPRDKLALAPIPNSPGSVMTADSTTTKLKPKPNVLRRPARLDGERSPRSASMGMPSPSPRSIPPIVETPRPRSNSMGTVFTFRELGSEKKTPLSEQEKADKFERLLEASEKAGGTLHARAQERLLLSETVRMSATTFDGASVLGL